MNVVAEWLANLRLNFSDEPLVSDVRDLNDTVCCPKTAAGAPPAGRLVGIKAWDAAEYALSPSALRRALGIATLNALSAAAIERHGLPKGTLREKLDALDAAAVAPDDEVVMVGAFVPFIKRLKGRVAGLRVIDKHRDALKPEEQALWTPPGRTSEALKNASVVILSGSALVEGGVEELLRASESARVRVMAGPTTPLWPQPFFECGVVILGGIRAINGRELLTIVGQGGSGYFFERAAQKVCLIHPSINSLARCEPAAAHAKAGFARDETA
jgi:uncharacterized protein (DUF4213/DUF364 family)